MIFMMELLQQIKPWKGYKASTVSRRRPLLSKKNTRFTKLHLNKPQGICSKVLWLHEKSLEKTTHVNIVLQAVKLWNVKGFSAHYKISSWLLKL